jgi:hypothetical protein
MTLLTPPGFLQAGTYSALLDRMYMNTAPTVRDFAFLHRGRQGFLASRYPTYSNPANMDISVSACAGVVANTFVTDGGEYRFVNPTSLTVTLAASSPTLNRIDIVGFRVFDNFYDASGQNQIVPAVLQGTGSAGAPSAPSIPNSFIPVVQALVNANAVTPTSLTDLRQYTAMEQSTLPTPSAAARAAIGTPYEGFLIDRTDRDWYERWDGTAWRVVNQPALVTSTADRDAAITNPVAGTLAMIGASGQTYRYTGSAWNPHQRYKDSIDLGADTASITFSNIPNTLRALQVEWCTRATAALVNLDVRMRINGNSGNVYSEMISHLVGTTYSNFVNSGTTAFATVGATVAANAGVNNFGSGMIHFPGWNMASALLTWRAASFWLESGVSNSMADAGGLYFGGAPYNSITLFPSSGNWLSGSKFTLYGWE